MVQPRLAGESAHREPTEEAREAIETFAALNGVDGWRSSPADRMPPGSF
jgi:hypothetical protein